MRLEEAQRALTGHPGAVRIITLPLVAVEAMAGGVDVDLDPLLMSGTNLVHIREWDSMIPLAKMHQHRAVRLLLGNRADPPAVVRP